jgi:hypothetical protein
MSVDRETSFISLTIADAIRTNEHDNNRRAYNDNNIFV